MLTRAISIRSSLLIMAAVFAVLTAAIVALPHDPYIRFQSVKGTIFERAGWMYERIAYDETPIDVVFVGTSRTARGALAGKIEAELAKRGSDLHVANLSLPASGLDIRETLIDELFQHHDEVKVVYISLVEALPRDGHQVFADLATPGQILRSPWIVNRNLPENLARLPVRQMQLAIASALPEAFGYQKTFDPAAYLGPEMDGRFFNKGFSLEREAGMLAEPGHEAAIAKEARRRRREITPPLLPASLDWVEFGVSQTYIERLVAKIEAHGAKPAFLFLPFYNGYTAPIDADYVRQFGPLLIADFLMDDAQNYVDAAHGSSKASDQLASWLADQTLNILGDSQ